MSDVHESDCEEHKGWHGETSCAWCMQEEIDRLRADRDSWAQQADDRVKDCEGFIEEIERLRGLLQAGIEPRGEGVSVLVPYDWCLRAHEALGND